MNAEDNKVIETIKEALPEIEKLITATIEVIADGGRIIYIGAGTSGVIGLMDAVECKPTFNCDQEFIGLIAGGAEAFNSAIGAVEDSKQLAIEDLKISICQKGYCYWYCCKRKNSLCYWWIRIRQRNRSKTGSVCCNYNTEISKHLSKSS